MILGQSESRRSKKLTVARREQFQLVRRDPEKIVGRPEAAFKDLKNKGALCIYKSYKIECCPT